MPTAPEVPRVRLTGMLAAAAYWLAAVVGEVKPMVPGTEELFNVTVTVAAVPRVGVPSVPVGEESATVKVRVLLKTEAVLSGTVMVFVGTGSLSVQLRVPLTAV